MEILKRLVRMLAVLAGFAVALAVFLVAWWLALLLLAGALLYAWLRGGLGRAAVPGNGPAAAGPSAAGRDPAVIDGDYTVVPDAAGEARSAPADRRPPEG